MLKNLKVKAVVFSAMLALASCGGGGSGTTAGGGGPVLAPVVANTGTVTVTTQPNNVVSIGASGTNFKTANATGKAVFTGLKAGAVDVHVFSADGYSATSYMGVNTANIVDATVGNSVVDVYVSVTNADIYGQNLYLHTANNDYQGSPINFAGTYSFYIYGKPVGSTISGTLYIGQGQAISSAGNNTYGDSEVINLGTVSFTTQVVGASSVQQNFTATFSPTPVTPPLLVTIQSVTPPAGLSVLAAGPFSAEIFPKAPATSLVLPDSIAAAATGDNKWFVYAEDAAATKRWIYNSTFTVGSALSAAATLTSTPTVAANQTGATIAWTNPAGSWVINNVYIYDAAFRVSWNIIMGSGVSSITLPTVPSVATSPLVAGTAYQMNINNSKFAGTYEQAVSTANFNPGGYEASTAINVPYTR